jgi:hypothetical protein
MKLRARSPVAEGQVYEARIERDPDVGLVVVRPDGERVRLEDHVIDIAFDVNVDFGVYITYSAYSG